MPNSSGSGPETQLTNQLKACPGNIVQNTIGSNSGLQRQAEDVLSATISWPGVSHPQQATIGSPSYYSHPEQMDVLMCGAFNSLLSFVQSDLFLSRIDPRQFD